VRLTAEPDTAPASLTGEVSEAARAAYLDAGPMPAVEILSEELRHAPTSSATRATAVLLADIAVRLSDAYPEHRVAAAGLVTDVAHRYGPLIADAAHDPAANTVLTARAANTVGWSVVKLAAPDPTVLDRAVEVLEVAICRRTWTRRVSGLRRQSGPGVSAAVARGAAAAGTGRAVRALGRAAGTGRRVVVLSRSDGTACRARRIHWVI